MPSSFYEPAIPEKQLLLCCARTKLSPQAAKKIRDFLRYELNWDFLLADAHEHSVFPLLDRNLSAVAPELIPSAAAERMKTETRANSVRCLVLSGELLRITDALAGSGISCAPYKGPVIASQAYGDITAREFEDLDIVLKQKEVAKANEVVRGLGYEARYPWVHERRISASLVPGEYNYSNIERRTILELHTELTLRHFPRTLRLEEFLSRTANVDLGGRAISTFAPEDALLFLSIHAAKDFWQKVVWITDVAELIGSHPEMDWPVVMRRAQDLSAQRMLHVNLALASDLFDTKLPMEVAASVQADAGAAPLAEWVKQNLFSREPQPLKSRQRFYFRRRMVPGYGAGWRYALRLAMAPTEDDWTTGRLPRSLASLYVLLRPLRLLKKYGWAEKGA